VIERLRRRGRCPDHAVAMEIEEAERMQADMGGALRCRGRPRDGDGPASDSAGPAIPSTKSQRNRCAVEQSAAAQEGSQRSFLQAADSRDREHGPDQRSVAVDQRFKSWASLIRHRLNGSWRADARRIQRWLRADELGPVAPIVPLVSRRPAPARQAPQSFADGQTGGGAARRSRTWIKTGPGVEASLGLSVSIRPKARKNRSPAPEP